MPLRNAAFYPDNTIQGQYSMKNKKYYLKKFITV